MCESSTSVLADQFGLDQMSPPPATVHRSVPLSATTSPTTRRSRKSSSGYTPGMKTAVSIPDELFTRADELARKTGKSRSRIFQEALSEYLLRRDPRAVTQAMDETVADIEGTPDPWLTEAARRALERIEW